MRKKLINDLNVIYLREGQNQMCFESIFLLGKKNLIRDACGSLLVKRHVTFERQLLL